MFEFSSFSGVGRCIQIIVIGNLPFSLKYISLSLTGSMPIMFCTHELCTIIATHAVYRGIPFSALKYHAYSFLVSLGLCCVLVA